MREKRADAKPHAQLTVTWEPLSYRIEGGKYGNQQADYIQLTVGQGLDDEEIEAVRNAFWRGIPANKRQNVPRTLEAGRRYGERWLFHSKLAGLHLDVAENGQVFSNDIGQAFEVEEGFDTFPIWLPDENRWSKPDKGEDGNSKFIRYPIAKATDYVQPADVPVRLIQSREEDGPAGAAVTATASNVGGVTAEALCAGFQAAGFVGRNVTELSGMAAQINETSKKVGVAPVLGTSEVSTAVSEGRLINFAVERGAITVDGDGIIRAAA